MAIFGEKLGRVITEGSRGIPESFDLVVGQDYGNIGVSAALTGLIELDPRVKFARVTFSHADAPVTVSQNEFRNIKLGAPKLPYGRVEFIGKHGAPVSISPVETTEFKK